MFPAPQGGDLSDRSDIRPPRNSLVYEGPTRSNGNWLERFRRQEKEPGLRFEERCSVK